MRPLSFRLSLLLGLLAASSVRAQDVLTYDALGVSVAGGVVVNVATQPLSPAIDSLPAAADVWRATAEGGPFERLGAPAALQTWAAFESFVGTAVVQALEAETGLRGERLWAELRAHPNLMRYGALALNVRFAVAMGAAYLDRTALDVPAGTPFVYAVRYYDRTGARVPSPGTPSALELRAHVTTGPPVYPVLAVTHTLQRDSLVSITWGMPLGGIDPDGGSGTLPFAGRVYRQDGADGASAFALRPSDAGVSTSEDGDSLYLSYTETVPPGLVYRYVLRPFNRGLLEGTPSDTAGVISASFDRVPLLTNIAATADSLGLRLSWTPLDGLYYTGVKIWRADRLSGPYVPIDTAAAAAGTYLDRSAPASRLVYYQLVALTPRTSGEVPQILVSGSWQNRATPPPPPERVQASNEGANVRIRWTPPADTSNVAGYRVLRSFGGPGRWDAVSLLLPPSESAFLDTSIVLSGDAVYAYTVESVSRSDIDGFMAAPVTLRPARPVAVAAPPALSAVADGSLVHLTWPSAAALDDRVRGYHVYRSDGGAPVRMTAAALSVPLWTDTSTATGVAYRYHATSVAATGDESVPSPEATVTRALAYLAPAMLEAWRADTAVALQWGGVSTDGLVGFRVHRRALTGDAAFENVATLDADQTSWTDPRPVAGSAVYRVAALYRDGTEAAGPERTVATADAP